MPPESASTQHAGSVTNAEVAVEEALRLADIPPERQGRERIAQLSPEELQFYAWILRRFANAAPPNGEETQEAARSFGLDPTDAQHTLARQDLVHTDDEGRPLVAYPFAAAARGHRVLIDGTLSVEAMCAIDALGIPAMLGLPVAVRSRDPVSNEEIVVEVDSHGNATWQPTEAVVLAGSACCGAPSFRSCCDVLNFFACSENAERYLAAHSDVAGAPLSIPDAVAAGSAVFGGVLEDV